MLETERLILRRFTENDIDAVFELRKDEKMMRFIRTPQKTRKESENWVKLVSSLWEKENIGFCAVINKSSGKVIGWCGLWRLIETGETEVGYAITKELWKQGLATEAAEAVLQYGFDKLNLKKIAAVARPENVGSRRVMEKLGMTFNYIGTFYAMDLAHYSITRSIWKKKQSLNKNR